MPGSGIHATSANQAGLCCRGCARPFDKTAKELLALGLELGDHSSSYCVFYEAGETVLEHKLATAPEIMKQVFGGVSGRIAMETGAHAPSVSRLFSNDAKAESFGRAQEDFPSLFMKRT